MSAVWLDNLIHYRMEWEWLIKQEEMATLRLENKRMKDALKSRRKRARRRLGRRAT